MNEADESLEQVATIVVVFTMCIAFVAGYVVSSYVHDSNVEEAGYHEEVRFCHDQMKSAQTQYIWGQECCGKTLDAVDPISGKPVAGVIEEN